LFGELGWVGKCCILRDLKRAFLGFLVGFLYVKVVIRGEITVQKTWSGAFGYRTGQIGYVPLTFECISVQIFLYECTGCALTQW